MAHLARSLTAMALVVLAAGLFVLADAFLVAAYAVVTPESAGTASGLGHAGLWLQFAAGIAALAAVCAACWEQVLRSLWQGGAGRTFLPMARRIQRSSQLLVSRSHPCTRLDHLQAQPGRLHGPAASMPGPFAARPHLRHLQPACTQSCRTLITDCS